MANKKIQAVTPIYQLKITLEDIRPFIFRIIQIKGNASLGKLHDYIQGAMGWSDTHLHEFSIKGKRYQASDQMDENMDNPSTLDEQKYCLSNLLQDGDFFRYNYDFGDDWKHMIEVEKILEPEDGVYYPICLYGERACPPEDCGGTLGYELLLEALEDPEHDEYEEYSEWVGDDFDAEKFDIKKANIILNNIKSNVKEPR